MGFTLTTVKHMKFIVNDATLRGRIASAISGSNDFGDTLHQVGLDFGYPQTLTFYHFWNMYRRLGIARNAVELPAEVCWMTPPVVVASERYASELEQMVGNLNLWQRLKGLDTRQRVGRYAGLFMRVRDGQSPEQPIKSTLSGPASLFDVIPLYEGQLEVLDVNNDPKSEEYGLPTMYQYNGSGTGNRSEKSANSFTIHPSRIVIAAEGADDGSIYGVPALEAAYNSLMDIRKIIGAGGEGFYRNAAQSIVFNLKDTASAAINEELLAKFNDVFDDFTMNRQRRGLWTPGLEPKALESTLANPEHFFQNALQDIAASVKIPATILIGQQTGRLASNEDSRAFLSGMNSRRGNFLTEMVMDVLLWCGKYGVLPMEKVAIEWPDLMALSTKERLDNARQMSNINRESYQSGGMMVFEENEIRKAAGYAEMLDTFPTPDEIGPLEMDVTDEEDESDTARSDSTTQKQA